MGCRKAIASKTLGISLRTIQRWEKAPHVPDRRKGPKNRPPNKLSDKERLRIIEVVNSKEYGSLSPSQIVPKLADKNVYLCSESTIYRLLKEHSMLCHRGKARQKTPYRRPASCKATKPNQVWSWDITFLKTCIKGQFYYLYLFMDIYSRKIVGYGVYEEQTARNASAVAKKAYKREKINGKQIRLHSDNGTPMKGSTMLITLQKLGIIPSFNRPSVSNDNPYSESLFRTLKYCPQYPSKPFESIKDASQWVTSFVTWYNTVHLHSGIKFLTPESRHNGKDKTIVINRQKTYELARKQNPIRWANNVRNWVPHCEVLLNPSIMDVNVL